MDLNKFYHFNDENMTKHLDRVSSCTDALLDVLANMCLNNNNVANLIFDIKNGRVPSDLDVSVSPSTDTSVRTFVEQLRTELPVIDTNDPRLTDEDIFSTILPNNAQFGDEINSYINSLRDYVKDNVPVEQGGNLVSK